MLFIRACRTCTLLVDKKVSIVNTALIIFSIIFLFLFLPHPLDFSLFILFPTSQSFLYFFTTAALSSSLSSRFFSASSVSCRRAVAHPATPPCQPRAGDAPRGVQCSASPRPARLMVLHPPSIRPEPVLLLPASGAAPSRAAAPSPARPTRPRRRRSLREQPCQRTT
jgi:hypothetical protein